MCQFCHYTLLVKDYLSVKTTGLMINDHPDNFDNDMDIEIEKKVLFHNKTVMKHGQNYQLKSVKYAERNAEKIPKNILPSILPHTNYVNIVYMNLKAWETSHFCKEFVLYVAKNSKLGLQNRNTQ
jgi:hypothetical protein